MTITHITPRELALQRENEKMLKTIRVQAAAIEELRTAHDVALQGWKCECSTDDACRFAKERDVHKADAARYQWLRSRIPGSDYRVMGVIYSDGGAVVDVAIDNAMKEAK